MKEHLWGETNLCCVLGYSGDIILDRTCGREDPGLEYFIHIIRNILFHFASPAPNLSSSPVKVIFNFFNF